jgi:hypothetical protein
MLSPLGSDRNYCRQKWRVRFFLSRLNVSRIRTELWMFVPCTHCLLTNKNYTTVIPFNERYYFVSIMSKSFKEEHPLGKFAVENCSTLDERNHGDTLMRIEIESAACLVRIVLRLLLTVRARLDGNSSGPT